MDRLRELRGPDTRERDLANLLGFEHSRAVRWKEGQMYVDRAEYLVRLADALDVETLSLVALAAGTTTAEQAAKLLGRVTRVPGDAPALNGNGANGNGANGNGHAATNGAGKRVRPAAAKAESIDVSGDAATFAIDPARFEAATRGVVLLVSASGEGRGELAAALARHPDVGGLVATSLSTGICLAERHRPELILLDLGLASVNAFDACRALSGLTSSRAQRRCRVVAGTSNLTDAVEKPALMAGAASVTLFPFSAAVVEGELDRLEERLGARKAVAAVKEARRHI
jgi:CheY-like chemotaxis protein